MVNCPKCEAVIDVDEEELDEGDPLTCDECGSTLHVTSVDPVEVEVTDKEEDEDEDENFDYDEDEDDEDEEEEEDDEEF